VIAGLPVPRHVERDEEQVRGRRCSGDRGQSGIACRALTA
jgi:hypothetical protein